MVKEVRQPCFDIDSGKFAAAHHRVHHGGIFSRIVVLAEEVVLARQRDWTLPVLDKVGVYPVPAVDDIAAQAVVVVDRLVDGFALNLIQEADLFDGMLRACRVIVHAPVEPASRMGPAVKAQDPILAFIIVVHGIAVRLERAPEVCEQPQRHILRTRAFVIMKEKQFPCHSAYLPEVALDRPVLLVVNYRHRRFIGLDVVRLHHQVTYPVVERPQQVGDILEPVAHCGRRNVHPETLHHLYLPVERKAVNIFAHHQVGHDG